MPEQVPPGHRHAQAFRRGAGAARAFLFPPVEPLQGALLDIRQQALPGAFGIPQHQRVEMRRGVVRTERGMVAACDHHFASLTELPGDFIRPRRQGGHEGDADHVALGVVVERFDIFVDNSHLVRRRGQRGNHSQGQHAEAQHGAVGDSGVFARDAHPFPGWDHQQDFEEGLGKRLAGLRSGGCRG